MSNKGTTGTAAVEAGKRENAKQRKAREKAERAAKAGTTATPQAATEAKPGALPKMPKMPGKAKVRKPKEQHPCACGCNTPTTSKWAPGHDARANGWAIRIERELLTIKDVPENERPGAKLMLAERREKGIAPGAPMRVIKGGKKTKKEEEAAAASAEAVNG